jgi:hypothetical protein
MRSGSRLALMEMDHLHKLPSRLGILDFSHHRFFQLRNLYSLRILVEILQTRHLGRSLSVYRQLSTERICSYRHLRLRRFLSRKLFNNTHKKHMHSREVLRRQCIHLHRHKSMLRHRHKSSTATLQFLRENRSSPKNRGTVSLLTQ